MSFSLVYDCPGSPAGSYVVHYDLFFDEASLIQGHAHANIVDYSLGVPMDAPCSIRVTGVSPLESRTSSPGWGGSSSSGCSGS